MYTRRQELICTENQMIAKPGVVLRDGEVIRIRMNNGQIYEKMGDGVTPIIDLPYNINSEFAERAERAANEAAENAREEVTRLVGELGVVQKLGDSETAVMSQKAVTDNIEAILSAFETTSGGYNLLNPDNAESGYYDRSGNELVSQSSSNHLRTVTPIPITTGANLYIKTNAESADTISVLQLNKNGEVVAQNFVQFSLAFSAVRIIEAAQGATAVHVWSGGVKNGLSFNNICVSNTEITEYEAYDAVKIPTVLKTDMLPYTNTWDGVANGSIVQINDVSPNTHIMNVEVTCGAGVAPEDVIVRCCGKNICPPSYNTKTVNGITFTDNGDGSVTLDGTATATTPYSIVSPSLGIKLPVGKYSCKFFGLENYENKNVRGSLALYKDGNYSNLGSVYGSGTPFEITDVADLSLEIRIVSGTVINQLRLSPMICVGDIPSEFEQGVQSKTYIAMANGVVDGVVSVHPSMTIFADTTDVTLNVEYDRDISYLEQEVNSVKESIFAMKNPIARQIIDNFQSINGWYNVTSEGIIQSISNDTENYLFGSQSIRFEGGIRKDNLGINVQGREFRIKFKINSIDENAYLMFRVQNDRNRENSPNILNFSQWVLCLGSQTENKTTARIGEWLEFVLPWSAIGDVRAIPHLSIINTIEIAFVNGNGNANIQMISLDEKRESRGIVTFTFDDGHKTDYTKAAPILGARGITATSYIIPNWIDSSSSILSEEQLISLKRDYNWDIEGHWEVAMGEMTEQELSENFNAVQTYIKEKGLGRCEHFAYPLGDFNSTVEKIARRYFTSARTIHHGLDLGIDSQTIINPYRLYGVSAISDIANPESFEMVFDKITRVAQYGGWLILVFHIIGDGDSSIYCSEQGLARIADFAVASGVDIKTIAEVMGR